MLLFFNWSVQLKEMYINVTITASVSNFISLIRLCTLWSYQECVRTVFLSWTTEKLEFKLPCWWEFRLCMLGHTEGSWYNVNYIVEMWWNRWCLDSAMPEFCCFLQVKGYFSQWQTEEVWRGGKKVLCMLDKPKEQLMGNVEKVLYHLLPTLYTVEKNDSLMSKVWSGCSRRVMRRNQERNREQIERSRCNQSAAGVRSCRRRGEHLAWQ